MGILMRTYKDGRLFIPVDVRRQLNIRGDSIFEFSVDGEAIVLKRYVPEEKLLDALGLFENKLELESSDLEYRVVKEIEKRTGEIRGILNEIN